MIAEFARKASDDGAIRHIQVMGQLGDKSLIRTWIETFMGDYIGLELLEVNNLAYDLP